MRFVHHGPTPSPSHARFHAPAQTHPRSPAHAHSLHSPDRSHKRRATIEDLDEGPAIRVGSGPWDFTGIVALALIGVTAGSVAFVQAEAFPTTLFGIAFTAGLVHQVVPGYRPQLRMALVAVILTICWRFGRIH